MKSLLLAIGFRTEHRGSEPAVLASGFDRAALGDAVNAASAEFLRFELGIFQFTRKAIRTGPAPDAIGAGAAGVLTMEEGLAMIDRIEQLEKINHSYGSQLADFEDVKVRYVTEIERLRAELAAAQSLLSEAAKAAKPEIPATTEKPLEQTAAPVTLAEPLSSAVAETPGADPAGLEPAPAPASDDEQEGGPELPALDPAPSGSSPRRRR